jgi:hypothetical protein
MRNQFKSQEATTKEAWKNLEARKPGKTPNMPGCDHADVGKVGSALARDAEGKSGSGSVC